MKSFVKNDRAMLFQLLIGAAMAVIIFFAILNIGTYINSTIADQTVTSLDDSFTPDAGGAAILWHNNTFAHKANLTMRNLSGDYDNVVDSLAIAAVVMAITLPLAAVVAIRKFF